MHPNDGRVVSNFLIQALKGEDITIYGDGSQTRSFCYVDDLLDGFIQFMDHSGEEPGPLNLGNPTEVTIRELAEQILKLTKSTSSLVFKALPSDDPSQRKPDISKAKQLLGWQPKISWEEGLLKTIESYRLTYGSILNLR